MSDGVDLEIIKKTQQALGKYIKKPPLTEKLLSKPPFRFLHDVVVAVIKNTGFLKDLFNQDELIADNVKEREAKLSFLNKLIEAVKNITSIELKVRASKIIAGAQPNETNLLLQAIAHGIEKKLDSSTYTNKNHQQTKLKKSSSKETKLDKSPKDEKSPTERKNKENRNRSKAREPSKERKVVSKENVNDKHEKKTSISSTRSNKSESKTKKTKPKDINSPESISKTSENVSIKEKYSERAEVENKAIPIVEEPVNNLVSINESVTNEDTISEFPTNDDDRPKTRDVQSSFLARMANKIPENEGNIVAPIETKNVTDGSSEVLVIEPEKNQAAPVTRQTTARPKSARPKSGEFREKNEKHFENQKKKLEVEDKENIVLQTSGPQRPRSSLRPPSVRPSSARPGAPRLRPDSALPVEEVVPMGKINVIVENFDHDAADDEETVVIHNAPEDATPVEPVVDLPAKNQSHLVGQILDQIRDPEELSKKGKAEVDWEQDNLRGRDTTSKEMNQLRNVIQSFTKTANPLGKLLNYLHEDIETMHAELQQWTKIKSQLFAEIAKQEKLKLEMEKPLLEKLENLKHEIAKQEQEIVSVRSNIIKNDNRIKDLINK
ncbi:TRAF3-interacting protein 1 [Harmonia axyridis]|uniref:TRAF3-interacting protein 1 n=1 Tax=Harmonia axyridis TaxID=115357 RepID=UPI001E275FA0|nr:TRAF3-interacting protein 1 [Harmonia axyridis]